ncbi:MAG: hypothetical protein KC493_14055 [Bacteriovoracaceae bacterium]|nr:hypothetical protein [Bacteriovoracaceae bacterium]
MANSYTAVRTVFFNKFEKSPCDLYLKLSDDKYVKILNKNDDINSNFIEKYVLKKIFEFFLTSKDFSECQDQLFDFHSNVREILVNGKKVQLPQHDGMNEIMEGLGVSERQTKQINNMSNQIVQELNTGDTNFSNLIGKFTSDSGRFLYDHSYLTAMISCLIASENEWGTTPNKEKLCLASILHELGDEDQLKLKTQDHLSRQNLLNGYPEFQRKTNQKLADKLKSIGSIPLDVISIIEGSHNYSFSQLSPMTCCFVVGHQFVVELYAEKFTPDKVPEILERMKTIFTEGNPAKQLDLLVKAV